MTATIYSLEEAGIECYDVRTAAGQYCGYVVRKADGTWRHRYNSSGSKGSVRKFPSIEAALESMHARRMKRAMKRAQQA